MQPNTANIDSCLPVNSAEHLPREPLARTLERFQQTVQLIEGTAWKEAIVTGHRLYNLKPYNIDKLTPRKVLGLYNELAHK